MFKKFVIGVPMALLALNTSAALAESASTSINITADIPTTAFHAQPVDKEFGKSEKMQYSIANGTLSEVRGTFDIRNTTGAVAAYVEGGPAPLFNGNVTQNITLTYAFNGTTLTGVSQEVVGDAESNGGMRADLVITATKPGLEQTGLYSATPVVVFDALIRTAP
ncbi:CS1 type fimbrial major subunit [Rhodococcus sp. IEGM1300]